MKMHNQEEQTCSVWLNNNINNKIATILGQ
jgi:hypothetical protein